MSQSYSPQTTSDILRRILQAAGDAWTRATDARFIREATMGTVPDEVFARYLRLERGFVETSARVRAAAAYAAPTLAALNSHRHAINSLLDSQHPYLTAAITRLHTEADVPPAARARAAALPNHVLGIAQTGDYPQILMVILTAEELYATWCADALRVAAPRNPILAEWIQLHTQAPFTDEVAELTAQLDALHPSDAVIAALGASAAQVLELEVAFHDCAYLPTR